MSLVWGKLEVVAVPSTFVGLLIKIVFVYIYTTNTHQKLKLSVMK